LIDVHVHALYMTVYCKLYRFSGRYHWTAHEWSSPVKWGTPANTNLTGEQGRLHCSVKWSSPQISQPRSRGCETSRYI